MEENQSYYSQELQTFIVYQHIYVCQQRVLGMSFNNKYIIQIAWNLSYDHVIIYIHEMYY